MNFLVDLSPWWWVAAAIVLAAGEMLTISTVLIWSALAALVTAVALWIAPGLGGPAQIAIFAVLAIVFTFAGRALVGRFGDGADGASTLNRRAEQLVGREGEVVSFHFKEGRVIVDGMPWPARLMGTDTPPAPGERVVVVAADGIVVWVKPLSEVQRSPG